MNKKIKLTLLILLLSFGSSFGQNDFRNGYIITFEKDTIQGLVDYRSNTKNYDACIFKGVGAVTEYNPNQIAGFGYSNDKFFSSQIINGSFVEVLVIGEISLYKSKGKFHIKKDTSLLDLESNIEEVEIDGMVRKKETSMWRGTLIYLTADCLENPSEHTSGIKLDEKSLTRLVVKYNKCKGTGFSEYKANKPWTKFDYGISTGVSRSEIKTRDGSGAFVYMDDSYISIDPFIGVLVTISSPRITENLAFQGELNFIKSNYSSLIEFTSPKAYHDTYIDLSTLSTPLSLKYYFPERKYGIFLHGGVTIDYHFRSNTRLISEHLDGNIVSTSESKAFNINNNQIGYWGGLGINKIYQKYKLGLSLRYIQIPRLNESKINNVGGFAANINRVSLNIIFETK